MRDLLDEFIEEHLDDQKRYYKEVTDLVDEFVKDFPVEHIPQMTMDEYLLAKKGYGNEKSFCRRIRYDLQITSSMGNAWPSTFEIYLRNGTQLVLSKKYEVIYGNDYETAFTAIKSEIYKLLIAGAKEDSNQIIDCNLNGMYKYKLLSIYYPDIYFPVCAKETLYQYCSRAGIKFDKSDEMLEGTEALKRWAIGIDKISDWKLNWIMGFCDWLWRKDLYYSNKGRSVKNINIPMKPISIEMDSNGVEMVKCGNCGAVFKKAPRCPECGQLIDYEENKK